MFTLFKKLKACGGSPCRRGRLHLVGTLNQLVGGVHIAYTAQVLHLTPTASVSTYGLQPTPWTTPTAWILSLHGPARPIDGPTEPPTWHR